MTREHKVTYNSNISAKIELRARIMGLLKEELQGNQLKILEFCTGEKRIIYNNLYKDEETISLDRKQVEGAIRYEALRYMQREGVKKFNYFDIDTYGSPYRIFLNLLYRLRPGIYGVVLTDGNFKVASTGGAQGREKLLKIVCNNQNGIPIPGLIRWHKYITQRSLAVIIKYTKVTIIKCLYCYSSRMIYIGLIIQKA